MGPSETRDRLGGPVEGALVGAENDRRKKERIWNKEERWRRDFR